LWNSPHIYNVGTSSENLVGGLGVRDRYNLENAAQGKQADLKFHGYELYTINWGFSRDFGAINITLKDNV
jgi:hypothetical protein